MIYKNEEVTIILKKLEDRYEVRMYIDFDFNEIDIMKRDFRTRNEAVDAFNKAKDLVQFFEKVTLPPRPKNPRVIGPEELGTYEQRKRFGEYYD